MSDEPNRQQPENNEGMTRGAQTAWIVGTIIVIGLAILYVMTRVPASNPYAECQHWYGWDEDCRVAIAVKRLNSGIVY